MLISFDGCAILEILDTINLSLILSERYDVNVILISISS